MHPWRSSRTWYTSCRTLRHVLSKMDSHGLMTWSPITSTMLVFRSDMYTRHSGSCSGQMTYCLNLLVDGNTNVWQSFLGVGICGIPSDIANTPLSFVIMSSTPWNSAYSWRSQSRSHVGAMHGVKLTIAPHITVLAESANAQFGWLALFLLNWSYWTRTKSVHSLHRRELAPERLCNWSA